jgi:hypothetical protein
VSRSRSGADLIDDAYKRSDNEGATDRHPRTDVLRYVNQGGTALYDRLIEARGRAYYRSATPWTITTVAGTTVYTSGFPANLYRIVGVRLDDEIGEPLTPLTPQEEPSLLASSRTSSTPSHYDPRPNGIALLPRHDTGLSVVVDYVPSFTDLTDDLVSSFDGINGWEEYIVCFAARCMAVKDEEWQLMSALDADMRKLEVRIDALAPKKDASRARRVQDVRGPRRAAALRGFRRF